VAEWESAEEEYEMFEEQEVLLVFLTYKHE
jgi:hypothetical protein